MNPAVMEAVRVPPSAWSTSQSIVIVRSPSLGISTAARRERPIRRCISLPRAFCFPLLMSRGLRWWVARGSIAYSAVIQPLPEARMKGGTFSSTEAVQSTWVLPQRTRAEPSA